MVDRSISHISGGRSASALGTTTLTSNTPSGYRPLLLASRSADPVSKFRRNPGLELNLAPLQESSAPVTAPNSQSPDRWLPSGQTTGSSLYSRAAVDSFMSPASSTYSSGSVSPQHHLLHQSRSAQEIKDQMNELRGRISSLREQARSDSVKRRSVQNLRTPSPFTQAGPDHGYVSSDNADGDEHQDRGSGDSNTLGSVHDEAITPKMSEFPAPPSGQRTPTTAAPDATEPPNAKDPDGDGDSDTLGDVYSPASPPPLSRRDTDTDTDSLYHDALTTSVSHEDRADAFDYSHVFLYSAMGSYSQSNLGHARNASAESGSSTTSVQTAREVPRRAKRESAISTKSYETAMSYMTADGGEDDDEADDDVFEDVVSRTASRVSRRGHWHSPSLSQRPHHAKRTSSLTSGTVTNPGGMLTPRGSPDPLRSVTETLIDQAAEGTGGARMLETLQREDQMVLQRLVAGLGRCVIQLADAGRASKEGRDLRRRLEAARRILEGEV